MVEIGEQKSSDVTAAAATAAAPGLVAAAVALQCHSSSGSCVNSSKDGDRSEGQWLRDPWGLQILWLIICFVPFFLLAYIIMHLPSNEWSEIHPKMEAGQWLTCRGHQEQGSQETGFPSQTDYGCVQWGDVPGKIMDDRHIEGRGLKACEWEGEKEGILAEQTEGKGTYRLLTNVSSTMMGTLLKTHIGAGRSNPSDWTSCLRATKINAKI